MRVRTYHRHRVNRSSPLLAALLTINSAYSLFFAVPVVAVSLRKRWNGGITSSQKTWCVCIAVLWFVAELFRLYFGYFGNQQQHLPCLFRFVGLTLLPQLPVVIIFNALWPQRDSLDYALSVTMLMLLVAEFLCSVNLIRILVKNKQVDFFVYSGQLSREERHF
ncbi:hypothetical protein C3747_33g230 [Trypanosoma cruzi]|uniref:Transmembrane protein n=2 Tax=Trypanosoma cruzi TaxID=5693 RepID=Q4DBW9_TRYCC|nr:hypothetical protein, conserved [Trypanosoma cruzi]EAN90021.1 hypothetical protein, conserved [Trypanosoma cruzi]KAF8291195.1 putative membrane protein [Trypanosoma cruzi]PWV14768.1 hypothetical protein C3747_33g230 [Trypanosoma cruzi]|eukprot:XP_811872.1 hypothetical protein [Trypanosoma cruzi strain CL Brener]